MTDQLQVALPQLTRLQARTAVKELKDAQIATYAVCREHIKVYLGHARIHVAPTEGGWQAWLYEDGPDTLRDVASTAPQAARAAQARHAATTAKKELA
ncbi:MAG: hypothetical protein E6R03_07755 [Hyphomicrobiaceae bacterium]|nr:MAG: hypothetical protein E6R03_07755 [Hyphomicrobiaceae bacterium]